MFSGMCLQAQSAPAAQSTPPSASPAATTQASPTVTAPAQPATEPQSQSSGAAAPTFRVDTREVVLDVVVTDADKKPVNNLKKDDFRRQGLSDHQELQPA
jgi:hypothetical protein